MCEKINDDALLNTIVEVGIGMWFELGRSGWRLVGGDPNDSLNKALDYLAELPEESTKRPPDGWQRRVRRHLSRLQGLAGRRDADTLEQLPILTELRRIATALERAAGVQEELAAPIDAGGRRHLLRSPPCPACGCLIRVEAGELFGAGSSDGCPGCGADRQPFLSWGHLVDLGLAAFDRQDHDRDRVLAEVVTRRGTLEPTTPEGAALVATVIREGVVVPPATDDGSSRATLPDGCEYPICVAGGSLGLSGELGDGVVVFRVSTLESFDVASEDPGEIKHTKAIWVCRCGERYELMAAYAAPLEPNGTERQMAADLADREPAP